MQKAAAQAAITRPDRGAFEEHADQVGEMVQPEFLTKDRAGHGDHGHRVARLSSIRNFEHRGHTVEIETTYRIVIDGRPYEGHASVDGEGRIRCHAIPYESYPSAVAFVKQLIDQYPHSFDSGHKESHS